MIKTMFSRKFKTYKTKGPGLKFLWESFLDKIFLWPIFLQHIFYSKIHYFTLFPNQLIRKFS